jgi:hypothetical protein
MGPPYPLQLCDISVTLRQWPRCFPGMLWQPSPMCGPSSIVLLVTGSLCGVPCGLVVFCGLVLDGFPATACGLLAALSSVGLLRLDGCMMKKSS